MLNNTSQNKNSHENHWATWSPMFLNVIKAMSYNCKFYVSLCLCSHVNTNIFYTCELQPFETSILILKRTCSKALMLENKILKIGSHLPILSFSVSECLSRCTHSLLWSWLENIRMARLMKSAHNFLRLKECSAGIGDSLSTTNSVGRQFEMWSQLHLNLRWELAISCVLLPARIKHRFKITLNYIMSCA